jgi:hypothetical protein
VCVGGGHRRLKFRVPFICGLRQTPGLVINRTNRRRHCTNTRCDRQGRALCTWPVGVTIFRALTVGHGTHLTLQSFEQVCLSAELDDDALRLLVEQTSPSHLRPNTQRDKFYKPACYSRLVIIGKRYTKALRNLRLSQRCCWEFQCSRM